MSAASGEFSALKLTHSRTDSIPGTEQLARRDSERRAKPEDVHEAGVSRASLDIGDVVPMNAAQVRELLLR
jgi:hypothetical protein